MVVFDSGKLLQVAVDFFFAVVVAVVVVIVVVIVVVFEIVEVVPVVFLFVPWAVIEVPGGQILNLLSVLYWLL